MTGPTPGPWIAVCDMGSTRSFQTEAEAREWCASADVVTAGNVTYRAMPVALALSAPDLLAACEAMLAALDDAPILVTSGVYDAQQVARTAIATARGGGA